LEEGRNEVAFERTQFTEIQPVLDKERTEFREVLWRQSNLKVVVVTIDAADPLWPGWPAEQDERPLVGDGADENAEFPGAEQSLDRAVLNELAPMDDHDTLTEFLHVAQQVAGEEHRLATRDKVAQQLVNALLTERIEPVGRFVKQEEFRIAEQCVGQRKHLAHALRVGTEGAPGVLGQPNRLQKSVNFSWVCSVDTCHHLEVLPGVEIRVEAWDLRHETDTTEGCAIFLEWPTQKKDPARSGPD
jgi:hypothetical protein